MHTDGPELFSFDALVEIPERDLRLIAREMEAAPRVVPDGEWFWVIAHVGIYTDDTNMTSGMLGLTSHYLILIAVTGWRGQNIRHSVIPLNSMSAIDTDGRKASRVLISHGAGQLLLSMRRDEAERVIPEIRGFAEDSSKARESSAASAPADPLDQLTKLAALRDQGVLSDEEFAEHKRRLLERM